MIYCQHSPAGQYAIILYGYMSFRLLYRCMFRSACRCFLMLRLVESRSEPCNAQQERDASSSFRQREKNRGRTPERQTTAVSIYYQVEFIQAIPRSDMNCFL